MSALTIHHPLAPARPRRDAVILPFPTPRARRSVPEPEAPALRITRRGRLLVTLLVTLLVAGAVAAAGGAVLGSGAGPVAAAPRGAAPVHEVTVLPGDTLWRIAAGVAGPGSDVRDVIAEIRELNGLATSGVVAGQQILVPAQQ